jgi:1-acyl-sn-glycerol-3-phosphate acyltransferase
VVKALAFAVELMTALFALGLLLAALAAWGWLRLERHAGADWGSRHLNRLDGLNRLFCRRFHRLRPEPLALPATGPALVVANHVSGLDPLLLIAASPRPLRFIIAKEQYQRFGLQWLFRAVGCIPVDRRGRPERALREAVRALAAGEVVALFPEGAIRRPDQPPRPLKGGVARLARLVGCAVYPVRIAGVRGVGHTLPAVLLRSHAHLTAQPPVDCAAAEERACLDHLAHAIGLVS